MFPIYPNSAKNPKTSTFNFLTYILTQRSTHRSSVCSKIWEGFQNNMCRDVLFFMREYCSYWTFLKYKFRHGCFEFIILRFLEYLLFKAPQDCWPRPWLLLSCLTNTIQMLEKRSVHGLFSVVFLIQKKLFI